MCGHSQQVYRMFCTVQPCDCAVCMVRQYMYLIIMELGQIFVRTNLRNWPKNLQLLSTFWGVTLTGISYVSLRNEVFPTFCLCLTTGHQLGFTDKLWNSRSRQLFANSSWGNAVTAFSLWSRFHVCDCEWYKLYSGKRCILREGKRLGGETVGLQYPVSLLRNIGRSKRACLTMDWLRCMPSDGRSATFKKVS